MVPAPPATCAPSVTRWGPHLEPNFHGPCDHISPDVVGRSVTRLCTCLYEHMLPTPHPGLDPFESPQCPPNHPAASTHACDERLMPELGLFPKGPVCGSLCPLTRLASEGSALLGSLGSPTAEHGAHRGCRLHSTSLFCRALGTGALSNWVGV